MNILKQHSFSGWVSSLATTTAIVAALASFTGCASIDGFLRLFLPELLRHQH